MLDIPVTISPFSSVYHCTSDNKLWTKDLIGDRKIWTKNQIIGRFSTTLVLVMKLRHRADVFNLSFGFDFICLSDLTYLCLGNCEDCMVFVGLVIY